MGSGRSGPVTLRFFIRRDGDDLWAELQDAQPRGAFGGSAKKPGRDYVCGRCHPSDAWYARVASDDPFVGGPGSRFLCDACAVEETISCVGAEDFLEEVGVELKPGEVIVRGHERWQVWNSPDGDDDDDVEFIPKGIEWVPSQPV